MRGTQLQGERIPLSLAFTEIRFLALQLHSMFNHLQ